MYPGLLAYGFAVLMDGSLRLPSALHPVAWFGRLAERLIRWAPASGRVPSGLYGLALAVALPSLAAHGTARVLGASERWPAPLSVTIEALLLYCCVCLYGLLDAARQLERALRADDLGLARERLRWLCSRDPSGLPASALANGGIESLAENLSDSVVAPLFYLACFGLPGAVAYRAINTLDAMIGYRDRYEWLGKAAARLDDLANFVPARLTALLLAAVSCSFGKRARMSLRRGLAVWRADRKRTPSPNGGHPMAMAAGILGVRLDKPGSYVLGASLAAPQCDDIDRALALSARAGRLALLLTAAWLVLRGGQLV